MHKISRWPELGLAGWGFLLNAIWEFAQSPLYTDHGRGEFYVVWTRLHCTVGDVMILLACFWLTAIVFIDHKWPVRNRIWAPAMVFTIAGLGYTVFSEWYNTQVRQSWSYADLMPVVWGIGLTPLLQWLILPPLLVLLLRRRLTRQRQKLSATDNQI